MRTKYICLYKFSKKWKQWLKHCKNHKRNVSNDNTIAGKFTLKIKYNDATITKDFTLDESIKTNNTKIKIKSKNILILVDKDKTYNYKNLIDSLTIKNATISIKNIENKEITGNTTTIGTDYKLKTNNNNVYNIIIKGDVTGDGTINSADLLKIVKYLKGTTQLTDNQKTASDCTNDSTINSADLLKIVKYLKGTVTLTF